ncbi:MAG: hypothetical protein WAM69_16160 [Candidatus Sulfotelmatobacter sp.]
MTNILVTLEAIDIIGFDDALMNQQLHLAARSSKRFKRMATAAGNKIVRLHIALELCPQLRLVALPFSFGRNGFVRPFLV